MRAVSNLFPCIHWLSGVVRSLRFVRPWSQSLISSSRNSKTSTHKPLENLPSWGGNTAADLSQEFLYHQMPIHMLIQFRSTCRSIWYADQHNYDAEHTKWLYIYGMKLGVGHAGWHGYELMIMYIPMSVNYVDIFLEAYYWSLFSTLLHKGPQRAGPGSGAHLQL